MSVPVVPPTSLAISAVLSGLSAALDITEGHPRGHAARTCLIAMRIGDALRLSPEETARILAAADVADATAIRTRPRSSSTALSVTGVATASERAWLEPQDAPVAAKRTLTA